MIRRTLAVLVAGGLLAAPLVGCGSTLASRGYRESHTPKEALYGGPEVATPGKFTVAYDFGVSIPTNGDLLLDSDPGPGGGLTGSYMFSDNLGAQGMFSAASATEEEAGAVFGGQFGDYRQETSVFALTVGPRFAWPIPMGPVKKDKDEDRPVVELFVDGGFGGYFTRIEVHFPRGTNGRSETDVATDFGLNGGGGIIFNVGENVLLGAQVRQHLVFLRFQKGDRFMEKGGLPIAAGVFADSETRSDELFFLTISAVMAFRF